MPPQPRITAFVLAGGEGARLRPLTQDAPKPGLPFAGHCRIIDFVLANLQHSQVERVFVLLQYKPWVLLRHLHAHWPGVRPLLPADRFAGTADAVAQALGRHATGRSEIVAVLAADHVYRMDLRQMASFHLRRRAGVTVAAAAVDAEAACQFGVLRVDGESRITAFEEKPERPCTIPGSPGRAYVSMGNYLFEPRLLAEVLADLAHVEGLDFGHDVIPEVVRRQRAWAYDFRRNLVPGVRVTEEPGYWRDVGTLQAYRQAEQDAAGTSPRFALDNPCWPVPPTLSTAAARAVPVQGPAMRPDPASAAAAAGAVRGP
ncbi:sugar phosphate nucleotidyltransferase [Rubrivivax sp. RP6-9]|uniref:sugar phosphate nucleotidyltransferase n=1 Tax=Rubrivivax sp. RP6-9 TaxID=3415750 RepID=UPI003CC507B6